MQNQAIDIHHHYVPSEVIGEAKRHGRSLGVEFSEDKDGTVRFSFNGSPRYALHEGLTDVEPRLAMMQKGKIAMVAQIPAQTSSGIISKAISRRAGAVSTTSASKSFSKNILTVLPPWRPCRFRSPSAPPEFWSTP